MLGANRQNDQWNNVDRTRTLYFEALVGERKAIAIQKAAKKSLEPYLNFVGNSIKIEEKKADYECRFEFVDADDSYKIEWRFPRYRVRKSQLSPEARLRIGKGCELKPEKNALVLEWEDEDKISKVSFSKDETSLSPDGEWIVAVKNPKWETMKRDLVSGARKTLTLNGAEVSFEIKETKIAKGVELKQNGNRYKIREILEESEDDVIVEIDRRGPFITTKNPVDVAGIKVQLEWVKPNPEELFFEKSREEWFFKKEDDEYVSVGEEKPSSLDVIDEEGRQYTLVRYEKSKKGKDRVIIHLLDDESVREGEKASCDRFVENEMLQRIYQKEKEDWFEVLKVKADDRVLYVKNTSSKGNALDENHPIKMLVDVNNLRRQRAALRALRNFPVLEHRNLIRLFEDKERSKWPGNEEKEPNQWHILNNPEYQGTEAQRSFVRKALGTKDFMLMEGPPGSGKTTAILELILQFVHQGKRVLLTASTHVAIDNILERIQNETEVVPIRIGRESSIGENVKGFLLEKKIDALVEKGWNRSNAERFLLDSSNLVCGTTMGIQNHPDFRVGNGEKRTPVPLYDVMIIDEASKTTFQEFLVPALYAKKWIIVGDIQQLSPYTETEYLKSHLSQSVDEKTQEITAFVFALNGLARNNRKRRENDDGFDPLPLAVELPLKCRIEEFKECASKQGFELVPEKAIAYAKGGKLRDYETDAEIPALDLYSRRLLLVESGALDGWLSKIPEFFNAVYMTKADALEESFFRRRLLLERERNKRDEDSDGFGKSLENLREELACPWAEAVSWRLVRVFERRNIRSRGESSYERDLASLMPAGDEGEVTRRKEIEHLLLPSILELLQKGNKEEQKFKTTLTKGFDEGDLETRFERLDYQHRMHPDISLFSREHFYGEARGVAELKDGEEIDREWNYARYPSRAVWMDVRRDSRKEKGNKRQNKNFTERDAIETELDRFVQWANSSRSTPNRAEEGWNVAILSYYRPQEAVLREMLQRYAKQPGNFSHFRKGNVEIQLYTVDKFQGREADVVFISMCRSGGVGFMDNTNRMNVALTRAKYQRVIVGDRKLFQRQHMSDELRELAESSRSFDAKGEAR